ncbi:MAG: M13 family metallopeptidase, partial [Elusimicrobiaceae bacterium]
MRLLSILPLLVLFTVPLRAGEQTKITGFDPSAIDRSANPCTDFYQFACGGWLARTEIPSDQSAWGRFNELAERNRMTLRDILQTAGAAKKRTKIGDFYAACMDEEKIESLGTAPLKPELKIIDSIKTNADVGPAVTKLYASGVHPLFEFYANQDYKNAVMMIAEIDQYGLGLPDRDYYLNDDAKSVELRAKYEAHIARMFALLGYDRTEAQAAAKTVLSFETQLAKASQDKVFRREPANTYHKMTTAELAALAPAFDWNKFFAGSGAPKIASLNVVAPDFLKRVSEMAQKTPVDDWKTYLRWQLLLSRSQALPAAFVNENFDFYGKTLTGAAEIKPRWKRCVAMTDAALGEDLGRRYVELTFGAQGKSRMQEMIKNIEAALRKDIGSLDWMTEATRKQAIEKLDGIANKIGYPDKWRDYSKLKISRGDALGNMKRSRQFELKRSLDKIGTPVDRGEWEMTPPTVNAYYNPQKNDINFPAGILQPPFFDNAMDDAVNYGAIGAVI